MLNLGGRVALITGGAGHIGFALGEALAELGADIAILDIDHDECQRACSLIASSHDVRTMAVATDLAKESEVRAVPRSVLGELGRLDILVNCAALVGTSDLDGWAAPFLQQGSRAWHLAIDVNLTAPFILTQVCAEALASSGHGAVINIGSIYGMVGPNWHLYAGTGMANPAAYGASKGGLLQLTRYLATALAPAVRVNMLTPGGVARGQPPVFIERYNSRVPLGRMAIEEDLKGGIAYLASDLSAYVTGHNLVIDGGWTIW
jgi:NAD(P)-dependent dehydrogenase (short-subunit alcohol dehydrogenase family)